MLAYVLGRRPDEFGLIPDAEGFVRIKDLLKALHEEEGWGYVNLSHLNEVLLSVPGAPFEIRENRIRCLRPQHPGRRGCSPKTPQAALCRHPPPGLPPCARRGHPSVLPSPRGAGRGPGDGRTSGPTHRPGPGHPDGERPLRRRSRSGLSPRPAKGSSWPITSLRIVSAARRFHETNRPTPTEPTPENGVSRPTMPGSFALDMEKAASAHVPAVPEAPGGKRPEDRPQAAQAWNVEAGEARPGKNDRPRSAADADPFFS